MTKLTKWIVFLRTYTASLASHVGMHGVTKPPSAKKIYNLFSHISLFVLISKQYPKFLKLNRNNI